MAQLSLAEKLSYGAGDAAANLVWRGALAYMAVFYTDTFGISAAAAAMLFLVVRLSDGITDILMGMIADRTQSKMGKFRPWILWSAPILGVFMVLCFSTPNLSDSGKLVYAYITYIGLTLAYTMSNVPYSALMGVMTHDHNERTSLSGFRFAGAFIGGMFVMGFLPMMVEALGDGSSAQGYQYAMYFYAVLLVLLMLVTVGFTRERVVTSQQFTGSLGRELLDLSKQLPWLIVPLLAMTLFFYFRNWSTGLFFVLVLVGIGWAVRRLKSSANDNISRTQRDLLDLLDNKPWLILLGIGFLTMMFNGVKYAAIAYYFKYYVGLELYAGQYFIALLVVSVLGALLTPKLSAWLGRKWLFIWVLLLSSLFTGLMFWLPSEQLTWIFILGCVAEFFAAMMPTLFFAMLGDAADYSEWRTGRRATGLVYSAGTFVQKTGGGFAGALVLLVLAWYGYDGLDKSTAQQALPGILLLMSWIPAGFAVAGALLMWFYPLDDNKQSEITLALSMKRQTQTA
ncbi:MFS transporter [Planctobacterium marinum]|uniref:MFS transporter n=1 Tax=Planctobacterium marinum TaxID=1631968 RepID=UPI001E64FAFD|nr:MFS transporter [Planctobacterium marinum]MCC2606717.1 MFS transporter [Planctobacterium marinum]